MGGCASASANDTEQNLSIKAAKAEVAAEPVRSCMYSRRQAKCS